MAKVEIENPKIITFSFRQEKGDPDYGTCLWARYYFDTENYTMSIESDCGNYMYGWVRTPETDGLSQSWDCGGSVFCNPPYGRDIGKWVKKAYEESRGGGTIVLLIPARTDTAYFHDYVYGKAEIRFLRGRVKFTDEQGNESGTAPFPSMLVIYNGNGGFNA